MYNPLALGELAKSIVQALQEQPLHEFPVQPFDGAGLYALYYAGPFPLYVETGHSSDAWERPIYVGRADPTGARTGGDADVGRRLHQRIAKHARSIQDTPSLDLRHFRVRYLTMDPVWISLGEGLMIRRYRPAWNLLGGFGINAPGKNRQAQQASTWDLLHPGRAYAGRGERQLDLAEIKRLLARRDGP